MTLEEFLLEHDLWEAQETIDALRADGWRVVKLVAFDGTSRWRNEAVVVDEELT